MDTQSPRRSTATPGMHHGQRQVLGASAGVFQPMQPCQHQAWSEPPAELSTMPNMQSGAAHAPRADQRSSPLEHCLGVHAAGLQDKSRQGEGETGRERRVGFRDPVHSCINSNYPTSSTSEISQEVSASNHGSSSINGIRSGLGGESVAGHDRLGSRGHRDGRRDPGGQGFGTTMQSVQQGNCDPVLPSADGTLGVDVQQCQVQETLAFRFREARTDPGNQHDPVPQLSLRPNGDHRQGSAELQVPESEVRSSNDQDKNQAGLPEDGPLLGAPPARRHSIGRERLSGWAPSHQFRDLLQDRSFMSLAETLGVELNNSYITIGYGEKIPGVTPVVTASVLEKRVIMTKHGNNPWNAVNVTTTPGNDYEFGLESNYLVLYEFSHDYLNYLVDVEFENELTLTKQMKLEISQQLDRLLGDQTAYWNLWQEQQADDVVEIFGIQSEGKEAIVELYSPPRVVAEAAKRGLRAELSIDLSTGFDLREPVQRDRVCKELQRRKPRLLVTCPPCTKFSPWQHVRADQEALKQELVEAEVHVDFSMELLEDQRDRGDHGLHEHPDTASSWDLKSVRNYLEHDEVILIKSHLCRFGLKVAERLSRKSTLFATTCDAIATELQRLCQRTEPHQQLVGGLPHRAQEYPPKLVKAIVDGLIQDWVDSQQGHPPRLPERSDLEQWTEELGVRDHFQWREFHDSAVFVVRAPKQLPVRGPGHRLVRWTWARNPWDGKWMQLERARVGKPVSLEVKYEVVIVLFYFPEMQQIFAAEGGNQITTAEKTTVLRAHVNLGHPSVKEFVRLLKAAGTRNDIIQYVLREFSCEGCLKEQRQPTRLPAATPRTYDFNVVIGIDLLFVVGAVPGEEHPVLNVTCVGTLFSTFTMVHATRRTPDLVWSAFLRCWLRVFGSPSFVIMDQGLEFQADFTDGLENHGIQPILIDRDAPYQNGVTERRGGLFKEVYYKTRELRQPSDVHEVEDMIHEVSWALQTLTNRSGYSPAQRVFGRQPSLAMDSLSDTGQFEVSLTADAAWQRSEEIRQTARKALMEVDARERLNRAARARPRRAREQLHFDEGEPVYVWRQGRRGTQAKVGPCFVIIQKGDSVWVTRRGELWKCNKSQVFKMGNLEKQGLEVIPAELLRLKERLRFSGEKLGYVDVEREGDPPEHLELPDPGIAREAIPVVRRVPQTPRGPPEGLRTPNPSTPALMAPAPMTPAAVERPLVQAPVERPSSKPPDEHVRREEAQAASSSQTTPGLPQGREEPEAKRLKSHRADADELWRAAVENQKAQSSSTTSRKKSREREPEQLAEWNRYDLEARRFRGSNSRGPLWGDVVRRITLDIDTNKVIADEEIKPEMKIHKLHDKLPEGVKNIQTTLVYRRVTGHPDPGHLLLPDQVPGQYRPPQSMEPAEDSRTVETGMKRSLEDPQPDQRLPHRSKMFGVWRADEVTVWGKKCKFPVIANSRDLAAFQKLSANDCYYVVPISDNLFAGLTKQSGKELVESKLTKLEKQLFDAAKTTEIENLQNSNAIEIVTDETELQKINEQFSHRIMPSRFILVKKAGEVGEDWKAKARWILLGHRDPDAMELERYAPTPSSTTIMLCFQIIASMKFKMYIMDVSSAFGQSDPYEREQGPLFASMPPTGIPGYPRNAVIRVLTAVYGLVNAPAIWRKTVRRILIELGYTESVFDPCLYYLKPLQNEFVLDERYAVAGVVLLDVDDFCQGGNERHEQLMSELRTKLKFGKWREVYRGSADYIGRTLHQLENFEIQVSMQRYIEEKLKPVNLPKERLKEKESPLNPQEITWLRGVGGSLLWVGKEGRPDVGAACAMAMSWSSHGPTVDHILAANKTVAELKKTPEVCIRVLPIPPGQGIWMSIADASMANVENKSQGGFIIAYVDKSIMKGEPADFSINSWKSHRLKRVVKATLGSEALAMDDALAELEWIRALWHEVMDPSSSVMDGTRFGEEQSVLVVRIEDEEEEEQNVPAIRIKDESESPHVTDAKALYDLLNRRSGNAGHCRRAQIDVSVICVSARALRVTTFWVPGGFMLADPLTKRLGNGALLRLHMQKGRYALTREALDRV